MKKIWPFIKKEFRHVIRDRRTLIILLGMPIVQVLLFGYVISMDIKDVPIAILDKSHDQITKEITNKITSSGYFILKSTLQSDKQIHPILRSGKVKQVIVFEQDFARKLQTTGKANIQIIADATEANTAQIIVSYTSNLVYSYMQQKSILSSPLTIDLRPRMIYNEQLKSSFMFVPGTIAVILMLISAMLSSISIAREKEIGTMEVLLVSPVKPSQIILGKVLLYFGLSLINATTILLIGNLVFGVPVRGSLVLLSLETMLFILLAISLGVLISTIVDTQELAMLISMFGLMLPTMLLSGFIYPIENMPLWLQAICQLIPPKWYIQILRSIMIRGSGIDAIWLPTLVLVLMTITFITLSIKKFKVRLA